VAWPPGSRTRWERGTTASSSTATGSASPMIVRRASSPRGGEVAGVDALVRKQWWGEVGVGLGAGRGGRPQWGNLNGIWHGSVMLYGAGSGVGLGERRSPGRTVRAGCTLTGRLAPGGGAHCGRGFTEERHEFDTAERAGKKEIKAEQGRHRPREEADRSPRDPSRRLSRHHGVVSSGEQTQIESHEREAVVEEDLCRTGREEAAKFVSTVPANVAVRRVDPRVQPGILRNRAQHQPTRAEDAASFAGNRSVVGDVLEDIDEEHGIEALAPKGQGFAAPNHETARCPASRTRHPHSFQRGIERDDVVVALHHQADVAGATPEVEDVQASERGADLANDPIHEERCGTISPHQVKVTLVPLVVEGLRRCDPGRVRRSAPSHEGYSKSF
jgi:hypothetical protein